MKKPFFFIGFITLTIICLSIVQVVISNSLSTTGLDLAKIEKELHAYQRENDTLRQRVLIASSLTRIASVAGELGFTSKKFEVFLTTPLPLAVKP